MRAIYIPADAGKPLEAIDLETMRYPALNRLLEERTGQPGVWIERVAGPLLHSLAQPDYDPVRRAGGSRFPSIVMVVDEEGLLKRLSFNSRASVFYNGGPIVGDVLLVGEDDETGEGPDFTGLSVSVEDVEAVIGRG